MGNIRADSMQRCGAFSGLEILLAAACLVPSLVWAQGMPDTCEASLSHAKQLTDSGRLRDSLAEFAQCTLPKCSEAIRQECSQLLDATKSRGPQVVFDVKDSQGVDAHDVRIEMDGELLAAKIDGSPLSVDPGLHRVTFQISGQPMQVREYTFRDYERDRLETISFMASNISSPAEKSPAADRRQESSTSALSQQQTTALIIGGAGVASIALGGVFALRASSRRSEAESVCPSRSECESQFGTDRWNESHQWTTAAQIAVTLGVATIAGGAVLWWTDDAAGSKTSQLGLGLGSVRYTRVW